MSINSILTFQKFMNINFTKFIERFSQEDINAMELVLKLKDFRLIFDDVGLEPTLVAKHALGKSFCNL